MKKLNYFAMMGAIALTGLVTFTACSSSEDAIEPNPDYNPETNSVKTEFTISLPKNVTGKTRMLEDDVQGQASPVFLGMHKIVLIPFTTTASSTSAETDRNGSTIELSDIGTSLGTHNAKVYSNVAINVGTGAFLFYGEGTPTYADANNPTPAEKFKYGIVNRSSLAGLPSTYGFSLVPIYSAGTAHTSATKLCEYVSTIAATSADLTDFILASYLADFKKLKSGSSASILEAVVKLREKVAAEPESTDRTNILAAIDNTEYSSGNKYLVAPVAPATAYTLAAVYSNYPAEINLPDGAASITWSGNTASPSVDNNSAGNTASLNSYVFPPSLCYMANSLVKVSDSQQSTNYGSESSWSSITNNLYGTGTVQGSTRSVALVDPVQYAVARMELSVKAADATLKDRANNDVTVASAGFPVSAVLIGAQKNVDFEFAPTGSDIFTIYDKTMPEEMAAKNGTAVGKNHTLVFETAAATTSVQIAIELTNNTGADFMGVDGVIPAGGKFYLMGELALANGTKPKGGENQDIDVGHIFKKDYVTKVDLTISKNEYNADTNSEQRKGLGGAYNVLPDLQTPSLELGLSVDLTWHSGLTFTQDI